jgi:hypothetical protein
MASSSLGGVAARQRQRLIIEIAAIDQSDERGSCRCRLGSAFDQRSDQRAARCCHDKPAARWRHPVLEITVSPRTLLSWSIKASVNRRPVRAKVNRPK